MKFVWDEGKNEKLISEREIGFKDVVACILNNETLATLKHPSRPGQFFFVLRLKGYVHVVPFLISEKKEIVLKTIFPSRKLQKKYGAEK